jgi:hypothetical protein
MSRRGAGAGEILTQATDRGRAIHSQITPSFPAQILGAYTHTKGNPMVQQQEFDRVIIKMGGGVITIKGEDCVIEERKKGELTVEIRGPISSGVKFDD